ncbi:PGF-CTERM protein/surface glycoprotein [Halomicrobium zhouii]|uniref:PGF-CTERM protein/surface glycoprotein n=1 Tax=Halomicrobium zhouii TaxID=767519 RepID=A0A1I6LZR0_9EURY|nr:BGTF surface domain-containing protein [Halomicrobium zhouii]SFS08884.1 PGF-CTERM protein/surface glycoprotein [Halomicrobium zhouii]
MTTTNNKLRSLFLAALMVFSVFAMTVALPGSAAANHDTDEYDYDTHLDTDDRYWGETVLAETDDTDETYELYEVNMDDDGDGEDFKTVLTPDEDGVFTFSTDGYDGEFEIRNSNGEPVVVNDGQIGAVDDSGAAVFSITTQTFDADFEDANVTDEDSDVELDITTNRGRHAVEVTADGLDEGELENIFDEDASDDDGDREGEFTVSDADGEDDTITLEGVTSGDFNTDFSGVDTGEYTFDFEVTDTEASSSASINVSDAGEGDIQFANDVPQDQVGDVADITLEMENTDEGTITIGSEDQNYWIVAEVTDDDEDGEVTVQFNSYTAGTWVSSSAGNDVLSVEGDDDTIDVIEEGGSFAAADDATDVDASDDLLDSTEYDMNVSVGHNPLDSDAYEGADEVGALSLQDRSTDNLTIMTAPSDFSDWEQDVVVAGLGSNVTQSDEVAMEDYAIVQIEASGLEGLLESSDEDTFLDTAGATTLTVEETDPGANVDSEGLELPSEDVEIVADGDNNTYYVAMDTSAQDEDGNDIFEETEYTAEFSVHDELQTEDGDDSGDDNVLNFDDDDEAETVASNFEVVEPEVNLDMNEDELVLVEAADNQTVSGTTNIAPGSELRITIESDDSTSPFLTRPDPTVQPDGTFNATADFSDLSEGTNLSLTIDEYDVDEDGQVVAEGELDDGTETATPNETETETDTETDTDTETETTEGDGDTETDTEESPTDDSGPGFTVVAALGALIAAALLAVRRND